MLQPRLASTSDTPALDAQVLLANILGHQRAWVLAHPDARLSPGKARALEHAITRLEDGEPLPYVLGRWEFFGLSFIVTPAVLIPRPETELLVEQALAWLQAHPECRRAADVGTGSGCIAVSLTVNVPGVQFIATDISRPALAVARQNAAAHGVTERIGFIQADLLSACRRASIPFDLICANLPYIPSQTLVNLRVARWEPGPALDGGPDGLELVRRLLIQAAARVAPGGLLLAEIEATQGAFALALGRTVFPGADVRVLPDLAGRERLLRIQTDPSNI